MIVRGDQKIGFAVNDLHKGRMALGLRGIAITERSSRVMKTQSFAAAVVLLLTCAGTLQAQTVRGVVVTASTHEPVEFANVLLKKSADSSLFAGTQTGKEGTFEFLRVPSGEYLMEISRVGYEVKKLPALVQAAADSVVDLGTIPLADSAVTLEEVTVSSQKDLLNLAIDRKVYNVDQDIQSKSISASDILRNVPSVEVEIDGRVTLRGSNDVLIMIDGKTSPIMGTNKAEVLEQIPASAVKKIEVMTNPSAKYKPDAEAGIINIVLKKGSEGGLNGGFTVNAGNDDRYNGDLRLDYSHDNLTFFGSYSPRKDTRTHTQSESVTQSNGQTLMSYFDKNDNSTTLHLSHLVLLGGDLKIDEANKAGISGSYFGRGATTVGTKTTIKEDSGGVMSENIDRNHSGDDGEPDVSVRTYFQHAFDEHQKMRADLKVSRDRNHDVSNFATVNRFPASPVSYDNTITSELGKQFELSLEYTAVLDSQSRLESGYSGQINSDDLDLYIDYLDPASHSFVTDVSKTNDFRHEETVHAAYTTYEHRFGQFGFKAGVRAEQVFGTSRLLTRHSEFENNYSSLYPSLHLSYDLDNGTQLQANYSRRIYRPEAADLNPFPDYSDPTDLFAGNPLLLPMFIHSMELGCLFQTDKISFLPTAFYRYKYNRFSNITTALNDI